MKHLLKTILAFALATHFFSCSGNGNTKTEKEGAEKDSSGSEQTTEGMATSPVLKNNNLNAVYQHYIHLTTALTNKNMAEAKIAANAIEAGVRKTEGAGNIASYAARITVAPDIETQRAAYALLSTDLAELIKKEGLTKGELYVDYCPMALNDKGAYWISNQKEIRNPYFGDEMMTCGEIKETIK